MLSLVSLVGSGRVLPFFAFTESQEYKYKFCAAMHIKIHLSNALNYINAV